MCLHDEPRLTKIELNESHSYIDLVASMVERFGVDMRINGPVLRHSRGIAISALWLLCLGAEANGPPITGAAYDAAMNDLKAGRPLPGLPNLNAPVFLPKLSLVCPSLSSLANPNIEALIWTRTCIGLKGVRVSVVMPTNPQTYLIAHSMRAVAITWRSSEISKANVGFGWVKIDDLQN